MSDDYGFGEDNNSESRFMYFAHQGEFENKFFRGKGDGKEAIEFKHIIFDHNSIMTGWVWVRAGMEPVWAENDEPKVWKANPGQTQQEMDNYKKGFNINGYIKDVGLVTWSGSSHGAGKAFGKMMKEIETQRADNPGKYPVVQFDGAEVERFSKGGSTSIPNLSVVSWAENKDYFVEEQPNGAWEDAKPMMQQQHEVIPESEDIPF
tara:strand:- start:3555 stop:4172 length:618 start_codon:yes stop_codon:yes gene_type:complete